MSTSSSRHGRTLSPPLSTVFSGTAIGQQKLNVVTRLAIEGKARKALGGKADGAAIKMFLKIAVPLESVSPGATIPLFAEGNVKILDSQVHPLDASSAPYNFNSTTCPLLHRAARALNLPARSYHSYSSLFSSTSSISSSSTNIPPLEDKYTGNIIVSGYHVSYVLPKEIPSRLDEMQSRSNHRRPSSSSLLQFMAAIDMWVPFLSKPPHSPYLLSIPTPRCLSNHIKLRIFPPGSSTSASLASLSSAEDDPGTWDLTSEPHVTRSDSHRLSRANSYSYSYTADDESSDSSTVGFSDGFGIQGTFPSAERIRVRWAKPMKSGDMPETADGRRRVGIKEVNSNLTCTVLGRNKGKGRNDSGAGVVMKVEFSATCKGVWFPGVATMLGMDIGLEAGECSVDWAPDGDRKWTVSGGVGFTGFSIGCPPTPSLSRQSSADAPSIYVLPSTPDGRAGAAATTNGHNPQSRPGSSSSTASLLRAPLPAQNVPDYSFESSPGTTPISSIASLATIPSSPERDRRSRASSINDGRYTDTDVEDIEARPPKVPITVHVNMNDLIPPSKNVFTLNISGTIVISPSRSRSAMNSRASSPTPSLHSTDPSDTLDFDPAAIPQLRVLHFDKETTNILLRNETETSTLDVYNTTGSVSDPQTRKTVLQPGGQAKCGSEGARIAIRSLQPPSSSALRPVTSQRATSSRRRDEDSFDDSRLGPISRPRTPNGVIPKSMPSYTPGRSYLLNQSMSRPRRDGPLMIPSVSATVTPLITIEGEEEMVPKKYAVRMCLPAPSDTESEWLEFGLALPSASTSSASDITTTSRLDNNAHPPRVEVASASVEGVPVRFETSAAVKTGSDLDKLGVPFEETSGKEWVSWVKVHVGEVGGGQVEVVYIVSGQLSSEDGVEKRKHGFRWKGKRRSDNETRMNVLLPTFALPVGRLEVTIESQAGFEVTSLRSNLSHQQSSSSGQRLLHYSMEEFFYPRLVLVLSSSLSSSTSTTTFWKSFQVASWALPTAMTLLLLANQKYMETELSQAKLALHSCSSSLTEGCSEMLVETVTVTTTLYPTTSSSYLSNKWWFPPDVSTLTDSSTFTAASTTVESTVYIPTTTSDPLPTITPTLAVSTTHSVLTPSPSPSETSVLLAIRDLPFLWPLRFDFPTLDIPEPARVTMEAAVRGFNFAWQIFRKVLHYPLDPP